MRNRFELSAEDIRMMMEKWCEEHDGDMLDYFTDSIYGEDADGNWIIGYGVFGSANIVCERDCIQFNGVRSKPFSPELKAGIAEVRYTLENC